jgi:hypothetical protein
MIVSAATYEPAIPSIRIRSKSVRAARSVGRRNKVDRVVVAQLNHDRGDPQRVLEFHTANGRYLLSHSQ